MCCLLCRPQNSASVDMFDMSTGAFTERLFHDTHIHKARKAKVRRLNIATDNVVVAAAAAVADWLTNSPLLP